MFRKTRAHVFAAASLAIILCMTLPSSGQNASSQNQVPSRITSPVDNTIRTAIPRSTHPFAQAKFDRGPVDQGLPMERMILTLGASPEQEQQLRTFLDSQQTKGSPDYHHWLTPEEFGQKFGPSPQDVQQVTNWLAQAGFRVGAVAKSGRWIEFSGTAAQVNQAFQTEIRNFQGTDRMHIANASDVSIPTALASVVRGVSLHDFFKKPLHRSNGKVHGISDGTNPNATLHDQNNNVVHALAPGDFALIYDLNPLYKATPTAFNGAGQTIAIVARSNIDFGDINDFNTVFGLSGGPTNLILNGPDPGDVPGDDVEATLDTEWSQGVAPGATIDVVISGSTATTDGVDLSAAYIVDNNLAPIMSISFGLCEQLLGAQENQFIFTLSQQAAAQGISAFVSAGDDGAAACDDPNNTLATGPVSVSGLASTPYVTAVGGTEFNETQGGQTDATYWNALNASGVVSVKGYIPEMVWNESCSVAQCGAGNANLFAGSGGVSTIYATPSYQSLAITGLPQAKRAVPDVSLAAAGGHDGYLLCFQRVCEGGNSFFIIGGTSASSPSMAGIMAIVNQNTNTVPGNRQGLANYVLYSLAATKGNFSNCNSNVRTTPGAATACIFNDITVGNNNVPGVIGFSAGASYDLATGLGSVDANNLANAWPTSFQSSLTTVAASTGATINITHGTPVTLTATVTKNPTGAGPTGTVAFETSATGAQPGSNITIGSGILASGSFSGQFSNLPGGTYVVTAHYAGDGTFGSSDSAGIPTTVAKEDSVVSLNAFTATSGPLTTVAVAFGDPLDILSVVTGKSGQGSGTGTVTFNGTFNGIPNQLNQAVTLNSEGQADLFDCFGAGPTCLQPGSWTVTASYNGDNSFNAGTSPTTLNITVNKGTPKVAVSTNQTTVASGQAFSVDVVVSVTTALTPTGTVQLFDGGTPLGSPLGGATGGVYPTTITLTTQGQHVLTASYSGDTNYNGVPANQSQSLTIIVTSPFNLSPTGSTSQTIAAGGTATYNLMLNDPGSFTGSVSFTCAGAPGGSTCTVSPNPANLTASTTTVPLTVSVTNTANARRSPSPFRTLPVFAVVVAGLLWGTRKKRNSLLMVLALGLFLGLVSCGGHSNPPPINKGPTLATLTVSGTSGSTSSTITLSLTITH